MFHKIWRDFAYKATKYFFGKKTYTELVYNTAYIEGCNVTFPQTQTILDGAVVSGISVDDCKINEYVSRNESLEWGALRKGAVGVGDFVPVYRYII